MYIPLDGYPSEGIFIVHSTCIHHPWHPYCSLIALIVRGADMSLMIFAWLFLAVSGVFSGLPTLLLSALFTAGHLNLLYSNGLGTIACALSIVSWLQT